MSSIKVSIRINSGILKRVDQLIAKKAFPNRSRAIQSAVAEKLARVKRGRLASECSKLDPKIEKTLAEEGFGQVLGSWPAY